MCKRKAVAPVQLDVGMSPVGRKKRSDAKGQFRTPSPAGRNHTGVPRVLAPQWSKSTAYKQKKNMASQIKKSDWKKHQSVATVCPKKNGVYCSYQFCPGRKRKWENGRKKACYTTHRCVQCSVEQGQPVFLCNTTKVEDGVKKVVHCHMKCHAQICKETSTNDDT